MRTCRKCGAEKPLDDFYRARTSCKPCHRSEFRVWYHARKSDPEWKSSRLARSRVNARRWVKRHPETVAAISRVKYHKLKVATPKWADHRAIEEIYKKSRALTAAGDHVMSVDHIIPISSRKVCGLHVPWNLRIIPFQENSRKGNHFGETQEENRPRAS